GCAGRRPRRRDRRARASGVPRCGVRPAGPGARRRVRCGRLPTYARGATGGVSVTEVLEAAREQVLDGGTRLGRDPVLDVLGLPDDLVADALSLAHQCRERWCGPEVEVEGIVSVKTGGCPEDCHFCSQSGRFDSPVRAAWLDVPALVRAAVETAATGASEFCV